MLRPGIRRLFRLGVRSAGARREQVDDELQLHIQLRTEHLMRQGLSPAAAREEALRMFGDLEGAREGMLREASGGDRRAGLREWLDGLAHDLRYAALVLWRDRAITAVVVVMLALGIGANAAMFGIVDRLLLQGPAGVREPERTVRFFMTADVPGIGEFTTGTFGYATYLALQPSRKLAGVAAWSSSENTLGRGDRARTVEVGAATADYFPLLGVAPVRGRTWTREEDDPAGAQALAVLDHGLWRSEFGADDGVLGREIVLGGRPFTVIGVMPEGFTGAGLSRVDVWIPMSVRSTGITQDWPTSWNAQWLDVIARLAPGVTIEEASAEAAALRRRAYTGDVPFEREATFQLLPLRYGDDGRERGEARVARWLLGVTATVLLIVCANVANLMLARAVARRREIAVRLALGISRGRLVRLLVLESTLRAAAGGVAAVGVAWLCGDLIRRTLLPEFAWPDSPLDARVLAATALAALASGVLVGLVPAWQSRGMRLTDALHGGARAGGGRRARLRTTLTVAQAALSVVLLVGAGLFVRSLQHVQSLRHGFDADRVLAVELSWPSMASIPDAERPAIRSAREAQMDAALERVRALPGVEAAAITVGSPFRSRFSLRLRASGRDSIPRLPGGGPYIAAVSPAFFPTMGTRVLEGRGFGEGDRAGSEPVAVVSRLTAATLWPGRSAVGECLYVGRPGPDSLPVPCARVVGVVEDMRRDDLREQPAMQYYVPLGQERGIGGRQILVRPRGNPSAFAPTLRREVLAALPGTLFVDVAPYTRYIDPLVRPWRLGATLFGVFGLLALAVAALGLYSLMAYTVAQRTHELGVRRALGAATPDLLRLVLVRGVITVAAGCIVGLGAALLGARFVGDLLFDTSPRDVGVFAVVTGTMLLVAVLASLLPARRAATVDPMVALRAE